MEENRDRFHLSDTQLAARKEFFFFVFRVAFRMSGVPVRQCGSEWPYEKALLAFRGQSAHRDLHASFSSPAVKAKIEEAEDSKMHRNSLTHLAGPKESPPEEAEAS